MALSAVERGSMGGRARMARQTPEQRKALASKGYLSAAVKAVVARAPELSPEQVATLREVFGGASSEPATITPTPATSPACNARKASKVEYNEFPYLDRGRVLFFSLERGGLPRQLHSRDDVREAIRSAHRDNAFTLWAAWPGQWRTDLFRIDDLRAAADAYKITLD